LACAKDYKPTTKHQFLEMPNLQVCKAMVSLRSRGFVKELFSWQWYYYTLTNEGIEYLRTYLHLSADTVPSTMKRQERAAPAGLGNRRRLEDQSGSDYRGPKSGPDGQPSFGGRGRGQGSFRGRGGRGRGRQ